MRLKHFLLGIFAAVVLAGVAYVGKWSYDRLHVAEQTFVYLVSPVSDAKGQPLGKASRADLIDGIYKERANGALPVTADEVRAIVQAELAKQAKAPVKK